MIKAEKSWKKRATRSSFMRMMVIVMMMVVGDCNNNKTCLFCVNNCYKMQYTHMQDEFYGSLWQRHRHRHRHRHCCRRVCTCNFARDFEWIRRRKKERVRDGGRGRDENQEQAKAKNTTSTFVNLCAFKCNNRHSSCPMAAADGLNANEKNFLSSMSKCVFEEYRARVYCSTFMARARIEVWMYNDSFHTNERVMRSFSPVKSGQARRPSWW